MPARIGQYTSLFNELERMKKDAANHEIHKALLLLASIDPKCFLESTAAALKTNEPSDLTWDYVVTTLIDKYNALQSNVLRSSNVSTNRFTRHGRQMQKKHKREKIFADDNDGSGNDYDMDQFERSFPLALLKNRQGRSLNDITYDF